MERKSMVKGIVRQLDALGRVTIPKEYRKSLGLQERDMVDIYLKNGVICIEAVKMNCVLCGGNDEAGMREIEGVHICKSCVDKVAEGVDEYIKGVKEVEGMSDEEL
jgi:transcriptional pleiotropic regulator of transition state genes